MVETGRSTNPLHGKVVLVDVTMMPSKTLPETQDIGCGFNDGVIVTSGEGTLRIDVKGD